MEEVNRNNNEEKKQKNDKQSFHRGESVNQYAGNEDFPAWTPSFQCEVGTSTNNISDLHVTNLNNLPIKANKHESLFSYDDDEVTPRDATPRIFLNGASSQQQGSYLTTDVNEDTDNATSSNLDTARGLPSARGQSTTETENESRMPQVKIFKIQTSEKDVFNAKRKDRLDRPKSTDSTREEKTRLIKFGKFLTHFLSDEEEEEFGPNSPVKLPLAGREFFLDKIETPPQSASAASSARSARSALSTATSADSRPVMRVL